jgi:hypothetical protein
MHMRNAIKMFGLVSILALSACGGGNSGGDDLKKFVGTWRATSGTLTTICPGYDPFTDTVSDNLVWSTGVNSDLVSTDGTNCPILADVTGSTASGAPGQACTQSDGAGGVSTVTISGYTFVIAPDGHTATENGSGTVAFIVSGATLVCTFNETGSYQKIGN